jgi:uncharacterized repeat protein (TIGR03803 family)
LLKDNQHLHLPYLIGTTSSGGTDSQGTVFELVESAGKWTKTVLHSFDHSKAEGASPVGTLVQDSAGNLYGTTIYGGSGYGTVFKLDTKGNFTVLYRFTGPPDGAYPYAGLVLDAKGNLYGTTQGGGRACKFNQGNCGVIFKVNPSGVETVLHTFTGGQDGGVPGNGALVRDQVGDLYGTTQFGGRKDTTGSGTVFELHRTGKLNVLYGFTGLDGAYPLGGVVLQPGNKLYGTTTQGGSGGWGTVFELDRLTGQETVLYNFTNGADGGYPQADLIASHSGILFWGTTYYGGDLTDCPPYGCGTVFSFLIGAGENVLHKFTNLDGALPWAGLVRLGHTIYGTASSGSDFGVGVVFESNTSE